MADLFLGTTGTGIEHHKHRFKALVIGSKHLHHVIGQSRIDARPDIDYLIIPFVISDEAHIVVGPDFFNFVLSATDKLHFFFRNRQVKQVDGRPAIEGDLEDRKSFVTGTSVSGSVDYGVRRIMKKK